MLRKAIGLFSIIQMFAGGVTVENVRSVLYATQEGIMNGLEPFACCTMIKEDGGQNDSYDILFQEFAGLAQSSACAKHPYHREILQFSNFLSELKNVDQLVEQKQKLKDLINNARDSLRRNSGEKIPRDLIKLDEQKAYCQQQKAEAEEKFRKASTRDEYTGYYQESIFFHKHQLVLIEALEKIERW